MHLLDEPGSAELEHDAAPQGRLLRYAEIQKNCYDYPLDLGEKEMKKVLLSLLAGLLLFPGLESHAQMLGDEDDTYLGVQLSIPLAASTRKTGLANASYSLLVVNRNSGISDGAVWTYDAAGEHTLGYLRPSDTFSVGQSRLADYTLPLLSSENGGGLGVNYQITGTGILLFTIGGIYILGDVLEDALGDLFDRDDADSDEEAEAAE